MDGDIDGTAKTASKMKTKTKTKTKTAQQKSTTTAAASAPTPGRSIDTFAAQCEKCHKWRLIDTQEEYEEIRSKMPEDTFVCEKKRGGGGSVASCEDAADVEYDATRTWVIDKPGIPKTPRGFKRIFVLRKDYSKIDVYYITPTGKKLRSPKEITAFLEANPKYKDIAALEEFNFTLPKVMEDTIPN